MRLRDWLWYASRQTADIMTSPCFVRRCQELEIHPRVGPRHDESSLFQNVRRWQVLRNELLRGVVGKSQGVSTTRLVVWGKTVSMRDILLLSKSNA
jgi:hypothetical protein